MEKFEIRKIFMPYCIKKLMDGRYIILNRNYKPLGSFSRDYIIYEEHPSACKLNITTLRASKLSWEESKDIDMIFLYNDGSIPTNSAASMKNYLERVAILMNLTGEVPR